VQEPVCPIDLKPVGSGGVRCLGCSVVYHVECFQLVGRCTTPGCPEGASIAARHSSTCASLKREHRSAWPTVVAAIALAAVIVVVAIVATSTAGRSDEGRQAALVPLATPTRTSQPTSTLAPSTATPIPFASPTAVALPDRFNCTAIRGTSYRSESERTWFLSNCQPTPVPGTRTVTVSLCDPSRQGILRFTLSIGSFSYDYNAGTRESGGLGLAQQDLPGSLQIQGVPIGTYAWRVTLLSRVGDGLGSLGLTASENRLTTPPFC
jgi:hypothetical protein